MKIYTSYFAKTSALRKLGIIPIAISLYPPKWFDGPALPQLAPKKYMLDDSLSEEKYTELYVQNVLNILDIRMLGDTIGAMASGKDVALLCFEKPGDFCHRHIVSKWLKEKTGVDIVEYVFEEPIKEVKKEKPVEPTLFD